jgi:peptide/nickel transport system permease protein
MAGAASMRVLRMVTLLAGVSGLAFTLVYNSPIDPIQAYVGAEASLTDEQIGSLRAYWGLDRSPVEQFFAWAKALLEGNLGMSRLYREPVAEIIASRFMSSFALMGFAWVISGVLGYALGVIAAMNRGRPVDRIISWYSYTLAATPAFWLGIIFLIVFAVWLGWFPAGLAAPPGVPADEVTLTDRIRHFLLPATSLAALGVAHIAMHTREKMTDVLNSDYATFARSRGERGWQLFRNHGFRNSIVPAVALQFAYFAELFGGSVIAERVFSYPGLGSTLTEAGLGGDVPLLLGIVIISAVFVFVGNLIADILNVVIDPRIRGNA